MIYLNERHRARFVLAARNVRKDNFALLSALYLLTADGRLWSCCKHHIAANTVFFEKIKLYDCSEKAYTLYCAAKDLTLGTKHISPSRIWRMPTLCRPCCSARSAMLWPSADSDS